MIKRRKCLTNFFLFLFDRTETYDKVWKKINNFDRIISVIQKKRTPRKNSEQQKISEINSNKKIMHKFDSPLPLSAKNKTRSTKLAKSS